MTLVCGFLNGEEDCDNAAVGHYDAEFWSGPDVSLDVCTRHMLVLLGAVMVHLPYGEGPARANFWMFDDS